MTISTEKDNYIEVEKCPISLQYLIMLFSNLSNSDSSLYFNIVSGSTVRLIIEGGKLSGHLFYNLESKTVSSVSPMWRDLLLSRILKKLDSMGL
jgi:hypothetical protein